MTSLGFFPRDDGPNRPFKRSFDNYPTPPWVTQLLFEQHDRDVIPAYQWTPKTVLEPCCGAGAICDVVHGRWPDASIIGVDVDPQFAPQGKENSRPWGTLVGDDALAWSRGCSRQFDLIITNPPYAHGLPVKFFHALYPLLAPDGWLVMLMRLDWIGGQARRGVWQTAYPDVLAVGNRAQFCPEIAGDSPWWFCWYGWRRGGAGGRFAVVYK